MPIAKKFRLKKDMPDVKAGSVFIEIDDFYLGKEQARGAYQYADSDHTVTYTRRMVEDNTEWFEEIIPEEGTHITELSCASRPNSIEEKMMYCFRSTKEIPVGKFSKIVEHIESVCNGGPGIEHGVKPCDAEPPLPIWNMSNMPPPAEKAKMLKIRYNTESVGRLRWRVLIEGEEEELFDMIYIAVPTFNSEDTLPDGRVKFHFSCMYKSLQREEKDGKKYLFVA